MHSGVVKNEPRMEVNAVIKHAGVGGWVRCCLDAALKSADTTCHAKWLDQREVL